MSHEGRLAVLLVALASIVLVIVLIIRSADTWAAYCASIGGVPVGQACIKSDAILESRP